jgi:alpha-L-fucosidase
MVRLTRIVRCLVLLCLSARALGDDAASAQHEQIGMDSPAPATPKGRTTHPDAQWFANAGLGLFIHFGLSSVDGRVDLSWGMMADTPWDKGAFKLTPEAYFGLAERFRPDRYDPGKWLAAARKAGFRYAVMTTKHHEGFALWPSAFGEFNTRTHLGGRDLVRPFVEACRANGLKVGLYYSPPDWYYNRSHMSFRYGHDDQPYGLKHEPITLPKQTSAERRAWDESYRAYLKGQIEELLTRYGPIDLIWFDGGPTAIPLERIRELQPGIVINPRMHGKADFQTAEVAFPGTRPSGWWEMCAIWNNGGWGYTKGEQYRSTASVLEEFTRVRAWGGNYLVNVGPRPSGELPDVAYQRFAELGDWMNHNGAAVLDTSPGTWPAGSNVPSTAKGNTRYLLVPPGFHGRVELKGISRPSLVRLLTGADVPFRYQEGRGASDGMLTIVWPAAGRGDATEVEVVAVTLP